MDSLYDNTVDRAVSILSTELDALRRTPPITVDSLCSFTLEDALAMPAACWEDDAYDQRREFMRSSGRWQPTPVVIQAWVFRDGELLMQAARHVLEVGRNAASPAELRGGLDRLAEVFRGHALAVGRTDADAADEVGTTFRLAAAWLVDDLAAAS